MTDIDGIFSSKLSTTGIQDINGAGNTTEGYVRTVDSVPTVNEALTLNLSDNTTFIDFAVSWAYLEYAWNALGNTSLFKDQQWQIALGSIAAANDHGFISTDIGAGADTTSLPSAGFVAIPEPNIAQIL